MRQRQLDAYRNASCPEAKYVQVPYRICNQLCPLNQRIIDVQDESLSHEHNEEGKLICSTQTREEEVDDGCCEHGCCRAVRNPFPPVGSSLVKKLAAL